MRTLVVIPARGGSKGIPRKNLRSFGGKPLIASVIETAQSARGVDAVVVSTDSEEIARVAARYGAGIVRRGNDLSGDDVTLDPVVFHAATSLEAQGQTFDCVLTVQPTSPLLKRLTLERIVERMASEPAIDTLLTVLDDTHLCWKVEQGVVRPDYELRKNRQELPKRLKETGGVLATRRGFVTKQSRFGPRVVVHELSRVEGLDIDSNDDWLLAEAILKRRSIAFIVIGTKRRGLGHVTRVITLMEQLTAHRTQAFCAPEEDLAIQTLRAMNFPVEVVDRGAMGEAILRFGADIVVHDELDTEATYLEREKQAGLRIVTFEDRGAGLRLADLVFNALYPAQKSDAQQRRFFGPEAYVLRDEFQGSIRDPSEAGRRSVLITFGGTDPSRLTRRVLEAVAPIVDRPLVVVAGKGLDYFTELEALCNELRQQGVALTLHRDVPLMSDVMRDALFAFSSAGRTVYELVHMLVPSIILAQNDLELEHAFAGPEHGCLSLGLGTQVSSDTLGSAFALLSSSEPLRRSLRERMMTIDLSLGRAKVIKAILEL